MGANFSFTEYQQMGRGCADKNIKLVIRATDFEPGPEVSLDDWSRFEPDLDKLGIKKIMISTTDDENAWKNIFPLLGNVFLEIDEARKERKNILIHCTKGASRSAAVLCAYLMSRCNVTYEQALNFVRSKRPIVELTESLQEGLRNYEADLNLSE